MRTESPSTVSKLDATENELEKLNKSTLIQPKDNQNDTNIANTIKDNCINISLIPALSMDVWLAFDLRDKK